MRTWKLLFLVSLMLLAACSKQAVVADAEPTTPEPTLTEPDPTESVAVEQATETTDSLETAGSATEELGEEDILLEEDPIDIEGLENLNW